MLESLDTIPADTAVIVSHHGDDFNILLEESSSLRAVFVLPRLSSRSADLQEFPAGLQRRQSQLFSIATQNCARLPDACVSSGITKWTYPMRNQLDYGAPIAPPYSLSAQQIPPGTLLPAMLDSTLESVNSKPGQEISAKLMQDVPLPDGGKIKRESKVMGHVVAVSPASSGHDANISLQFDQIDIDKHLVPISVGLRALASMEVGWSGAPTRQSRLRYWDYWLGLEPAPGRWAGCLYRPTNRQIAKRTGGWEDSRARRRPGNSDGQPRARLPWTDWQHFGPGILGLLH